MRARRAFEAYELTHPAPTAEQREEWVREQVDARNPNKRVAPGKMRGRVTKPDAKVKPTRGKK